MKILPWLVSFIASYVGWWLGSFFGTAAGIIGSLIAMGVGTYYGRRWAMNLLG